MEQNMVVISKKFWKIVKVAYFMLRKGISKGKIFADLSLMMKRGKIAGKLEAMQNLMFHHHGAAFDRQLSFPIPENEYEYEFSCSDSPAAYLPTFHLPNFKRKHLMKAPMKPDLVAEAMQMMISSAGESPGLPGFGPSPMVRQLRITDSPFPLKEQEDDDDNRVDEAAEEFICKFYKDLKRQPAF